MKTNILHGIVEKSKTRVECLICGVCIPKAKKCIEQHAYGAKHREHMKTLAQNGVRFTTNNELHCKLCKRVIEEGETVVDHITRDDHATWMAALTDLVDGEYIDLPEYFRNEDEEILCQVCKCPFSFSLGAIEQHVNWSNHRSNLAEKLKPLNALFAVEDSSELWCKICNDYITNDIKSVLEHIDSDSEHVGWFENIEDYIHDQGLSIEEYLSSEHKLTAICHYCHVDVLCDIFSMEYHIHSDLHASNTPKPQRDQT